MATIATTPDNATGEQSNLSIKTENVVYGRFVKATFNENTQKTDYTTKVVRAFTPEDVAALEKEGYKLQASQTVLTYRAGSVEGFSQIVPDNEESMNIWNRGFAQKESNKLVALLGESDEQGNPVHEFTEDAYDSRELMASVTNRRNLSPVDKAIKNIRSSQLPEAVKAALIENLMTQMAAL